MKRLLYSILFGALLVAGISSAAVTTNPDITGIPSGGGGISEGDDVGFGNITATRLQVNDGTAAAPSIAVGASNKGFYEKGSTQLGVTINGASRWLFNTNYFNSDNTSGPSLANGAATATFPTINPSRGDSNTGIGSSGADQLSLIAGAVEGIRVYKNGVDIKTGVAFSGISSIAADYVMGNFTADPTFFIECDATLGNISTTLPLVADKKGRLVEMKLTSATNGCYFDGNGAETIDGAAGQSITTQYNAISLIAGVTEWLIR